MLSPLWGSLLTGQDRPEALKGKIQAFTHSAIKKQNSNTDQKGS